MYSKLSWQFNARTFQSHKNVTINKKTLYFEKNEAKCEKIY